MKTRLVFAVIVPLVIGCSGESTQEKSSVTYHEDVAPIMRRHCLECHQQDGAAPFAYASYGDVKRRASQIQVVTESGFMPPWLPEKGHGEFKNSRRLSVEELATIAKWVASGSLEGESQEKTPDGGESLADGPWRLGEPDLVLTTPAFQLPADGPDQFRNFILKLPFSDARWVEAVEFIPGDARPMHHIRLGLDESGVSRELDSQDESAGYGGMMWATDPPGQLVNWTPGKRPTAPSKGVAWRLHPSNDLVLQLHLQPTGKPEQVKARVGLHFASGPPTRKPFVLQLGRRDLNIPAGDPSYEAVDTFELPVDVSAVSIYPHAHSLCTKVRASAVLPDGQKKWLLRIDEFDENWQDVYEFREPVHLPKGAKIEVAFTYDNSADNPRNPFSPPRQIGYGRNATDEMADVYLRLFPVKGGQLDVLKTIAAKREMLANIGAYRSILQSDPEDMWSRNALAVLILQTGEVDEAITVLKEAIAFDSDFALSHVNLGQAYLADGVADDALKQFEQALAIDEDEWRAHLGRAGVLLARGEAKEAETAYRRVLELNPHSHQAHRAMGGIFEAGGELEKAVRHYDQAVDVVQDDVQTRVKLSALLAGSGKLEDAIEALQVAVSHRSGDASLHNNIGILYLSNRQLDLAMPHFTQAVRLAPDNASARLNLGMSLLMKQRASQALEHLQAARRLSPNDATILVQLAAAHRAQGDFEPAMKTYGEILGADPNNLDALNSLAWILATHPTPGLRNGTRAVELAEKARSLVDNQPEILDTLAAAYAEVGRYEDAVDLTSLATKICLETGNSELGRIIQQRQQLYAAGKPFREEQ